jgi:hypothetical protein
MVTLVAAVVAFWFGMLVMALAAMARDDAR